MVPQKLLVDGVDGLGVVARNDIPDAVDALLDVGLLVSVSLVQEALKRLGGPVAAVLEPARVVDDEVRVYPGKGLFLVYVIKGGRIAEEGWRFLLVISGTLTPLNKPKATYLELDSQDFVAERGLSVALFSHEEDSKLHLRMPFHEGSGPGL